MSAGQARGATGSAADDEDARTQERWWDDVNATPAERERARAAVAQFNRDVDAATADLEAGRIDENGFRVQLGRIHGRLQVQEVEIFGAERAKMLEAVKLAHAEEFIQRKLDRGDEE